MANKKIKNERISTMAAARRERASNPSRSEHPTTPDTIKTSMPFSNLAGGENTYHFQI